MSEFLRRVSALPRLGIGVSTEYGAHQTAPALDLPRLRRDTPAFGGFLELGVEVAKGLDADAQAWIAAGHPTTWHFLDVNLHEPTDFDAPWLDALGAMLERVRPAWLCGDAGLWHFGTRERGHMLLLPPVLTDDSATALARGVARLREATGLEVLPENPPGTAFVGDLHVLEFFARVAERADTGLLLDVAHLGMAQRARGVDALFGMDAFALERVVEVHVAGGVERELDGYRYVEDSHGTAVLEDTWRIFDHVATHARNLRAVVFECERNDNTAVQDGFARIARSFAP